ncbi:thiazolylpeptide-type bacteriocin [Sandaracinobacteroides saxicola]|uniref:Thiazolylpeptide-type bacteriocin n=1 Tax=Sandaracinobacteroides saxicola TaxID=2759707 RepID=A0A7G5IIU3_9SPHN|nr:thiazolylpeptide-type bacteriocin [Sandaracinobacteroides saxicola]QMW23285.1 thiazolylpeptide-type bacteriocin [Sandaracinobacteroides saxicola]
MSLQPQDELSFDALDLSDLQIDGLEVISLKEAMALPETGASSGISSCNSCSSCGSSSCVALN